MNQKESPQAPTEAKRSGPMPTILMASVLVGIGAFAIYYFGFARNRVETDDAYVNGNLVRLTPQVSGTVIAINTEETRYVRRGEVLVELDPQDADTTLAQARANLGQTVRDVAQLFAQEARDVAAVDAQQTLFDRAMQDLERDRPMFDCTAYRPRH